jgi:hypothetical protein
MTVEARDLRRGACLPLAGHAGARRRACRHTARRRALTSTSRSSPIYLKYPQAVRLPQPALALREETGRSGAGGNGCSIAVHSMSSHQGVLAAVISASGDRTRRARSTNCVHRRRRATSIRVRPAGAARCARHRREAGHARRCTRTAAATRRDRGAGPGARRRLDRFRLSIDARNRSPQRRRRGAHRPGATLGPVHAMNARRVGSQCGWLREGRRGEWWFHSQAARQSRRRISSPTPQGKPTGGRMALLPLR